MQIAKKYKVILVFSFLLILIVMFLLYYLFMHEIVSTFQIYEEALLLTIITFIKILVVGVSGIYLLNKWFKQEELYFSDLPFLMGLVFLILVIGKLFDYFLYFINIQVSSQLLLFFAKIRYGIIILNLFPMIYLSLKMVFFYVSIHREQSIFKDRMKRERSTKQLLLLIAIIQISIVIFAPTYKSLFYVLPFFVIPSLVMIVWVFAFAHKNNKLTEINPLVVSIGWALYLSTTIFRSLGQNIADLPIFLIISEILEIGSFIVIFFGFRKN